MSFVIIQSERFALELGETILGGTGHGALVVDPLAQLAPFAAIHYPVDGRITIRRTGSEPVTVNGAALGAQPRELRHGDLIEAVAVRIAFGEIRSAGRTNRAPGVTEELLLHQLLGEPVPTAATGGRLTRRSDGTVYLVPEQGLTIGRDPDVDVVIAAKDVSRRHATVSPRLLGYVVTDESTNGVWVNGVRIDGSRTLGQGDILRVGGEELVFQADDASFEPTVGTEESATSMAPGSVHATRDARRPILASLEVLTEGALKGHRYRVERPTVQIGRGTENDIQIANEGVSGTHASLILRGTSWHVVDLGSRNGTYVDEQVVREQRVLPSVCELRLGPVALLFRAIGAVDPSKAQGTVGVIGLREDGLGR